MLKQGDDLVAALNAVRADEGRLGGAESHRAGILCSHRSAKTPNPDDPIPNFVRGRESTWLTFVLEILTYRLRLCSLWSNPGLASPPIVNVFERNAQDTRPS